MQTQKEKKKQFLHYRGIRTQGTYLHKFQFEVEASKTLIQFIFFPKILQNLCIICIFPGNF
jgi:hypothetical protein